MKTKHLELINKFIGDFKSEMIDEKWVELNHSGPTKIMISNYGRMAQYIKKHKRWSLKIPLHTKKGYYQTKIDHKGLAIHRLVAFHFIENTFNKPQINHKNTKKDDNRVDNLEWATQSENSLHAYANNLMIRYKGALNGNSKLTNEQVIEIRELRKNNMIYSDIAKKYGIGISMVGYIINRQCWKDI